MTARAKERQSKYMTFSHIERARKNSDNLVAIFNRVKDDEYRIAPPNFRSSKKVVAVYVGWLDYLIKRGESRGIIPSEFRKAKIALAEYTPPPR